LEKDLASLEEQISTTTVQEGCTVEDFKVIYTRTGVRLINKYEEAEMKKWDEKQLGSAHNLTESGQAQPGDNRAQPYED